MCVYSRFDPLAAPRAKRMQAGILHISVHFIVEQVLVEGMVILIDYTQVLVDI